ncbi:hypothetical protein [Solemya elarraichensis gill symbiont]|uniref:Uncharacterized protein n=1 Tax=Solemya elarraichensis gill symbiont TaxID=1918949 RepID=A0A1T2KZA9_9GAMM|nr:hypothetical protein [Solemya elarraichensis gill symbiont]OOZ38188.1 hypothetical protein BOW52_09095 [Solemya elarraichensis gill symbiont]
MTPASIGLLYPGEMGITVAAALQDNKHKVYWLPEERSGRTREWLRLWRLLLPNLIKSSIEMCPPPSREISIN